MSVAAVRAAVKNAPVSDAGRLPWWVPALTAGLLAVGFTRQRYATPAAADDNATAGEPGRGRLASTPSEIPARGFKDVLLRVWNNIGEDRIMLVAAGVTFYALFAIFPAIAALSRSTACSPIRRASRLPSTISPESSRAARLISFARR